MIMRCRSGSSSIRARIPAWGLLGLAFCSAQLWLTTAQPGDWQLRQNRDVMFPPRNRPRNELLEASAGQRGQVNKQQHKSVDPGWYMQRGIRPISRFGKRQNLDWAALPRRLQLLQSVKSRANPGWVESRLVKRISNRLSQMLYSS